MMAAGGVKAMLDSDHGGGDACGGEAPAVMHADSACGRDTHYTIEDHATGLKQVVERTFEQGEDGKVRPVLKIKTLAITDQPRKSD